MEVVQADVTMSYGAGWARGGLDAVRLTLHQ